MGLFDDLLVGGAGLAFVEHEHTKHQRQRLEQQAYLAQQQQQQQGGMARQYQGFPPPPPPQQGSRDVYGYGGGAPAVAPACAFCPNCGFSLQGPPPQQQQGYQQGYQPARSPAMQGATNATGQ